MKEDHSPSWFTYVLIIALLVSIAGFDTRMPAQYLTNLAGGAEGNIFKGFPPYSFWWLWSLVICLSYFLSIITSSGRRTSCWLPGIYTVLLVTWYFLPIIINGVSNLIALTKNRNIANTLFSYRWKAQLAMIIGIACLIVIKDVLLPMIKRKTSSRPYLR